MKLIYLLELAISTYPHFKLEHDLSHTSSMCKTTASNMIFLHELFIILRFGLVGIISTAIHIAVAWFLITNYNIKPILANALAFFTAFLFSFSGNYLWTFRSSENLDRAIFRFFLVSLSLFLANSLLLTFLLHKAWFSPAASAVFSSSITPILSFLASRFWAFK